MTQSLNVKDLGSWKTVRDLFVKEAGVWVPVRRAFTLTGGVWKQFFQDEVVVTLSSSATHIVLKTLFTSDEWANTLLNKRVVVPAGVTIGTASLSQVIMPTPTADGQAGSFGGDLTLEVSGTLSGLGGAANSGVGGTVILGNLPGIDGRNMIVNLMPGGVIRAGGGGGGKGGKGGAGSYQSPYTFTEGPFYVNPPGYVAVAGWNYYWAGSLLNPGPGGPNPYDHSDGWRYAPVTLQSGTAYSIKRSQTRYNTIATVGGTAGNGGRGRGYDGAPTTGAAAVAGGTNAGASGKSGDGGEWGLSGQMGATGAAGNAGVGLIGSAGGAAGYYLNGLANVTLNNLGGTLQGRVA